MGLFTILSACSTSTLLAQHTNYTLQDSGCRGDKWRRGVACRLDHRDSQGSIRQGGQDRLQEGGGQQAVRHSPGQEQRQLMGRIWAVQNQVLPQQHSTCAAAMYVHAGRCLGTCPYGCGIVLGNMQAQPAGGSKKHHSASKVRPSIAFSDKDNTVCGAAQYILDFSAFARGPCEQLQNPSS